MLTKFQNSFAPDKNLQILIESFNQSQKNPNNLQNRRFQQPPYMVPPGRPNGQPSGLSIYQEKVSISFPQNASITTNITNDQQDIILKLTLNQRLIQIITIDRSSREQKEEESQAQTTIPTHQYKQKIDIRLEEIDEIEVNGQEGTINIVTKAAIRQQKNEQYKKPIQSVHNDILNKNEQQIVQIQCKLLKDWHTKISANPQNAKKALQDFIKSLLIPKIKFTAFENQQQIEQPIQIEKQQIVKQPEAVPDNEPSLIQNVDLQYLFPPVTEEFVQRQKEAIERKNLSKDEKIKRLFEEVRIKQFKSQPYSADKNVFKCPYHKCQKGYKRPNQLKIHLRNSHQKLQEIGLTIDDNGEFQFNDKMLDYCLILWKVYPNFVKSVINEMKQRKEQPSA